MEGHSRQCQREGSHSRQPRSAGLFKSSCLWRQKPPRGLFLGPKRRLLLRTVLLIRAQRAPAQPPKPSHITTGPAEARHRGDTFPPSRSSRSCGAALAGSLASTLPCCLGSTAHRASGEPEVCAPPGPWLPAKAEARPRPARGGLQPRSQRPCACCFAAASKTKR